MKAWTDAANFRPRPSLFVFPGLSSRPFYDRTRFTWAQTLQENVQTIKGEYLKLRQAKVRQSLVPWPASVRRYLFCVLSCYCAARYRPPGLLCCLPASVRLDPCCVLYCCCAIDRQGYCAASLSIPCASQTTSQSRCVVLAARPRCNQITLKMLSISCTRETGSKWFNDEADLMKL